MLRTCPPELSALGAMIQPMGSVSKISMQVLISATVVMLLNPSSLSTDEIRPRSVLAGATTTIFKSVFSNRLASFHSSADGRRTTQHAGKCAE